MPELSPQTEIPQQQPHGEATIQFMAQLSSEQRLEYLSQENENGEPIWHVFLREHSGTELRKSFWDLLLDSSMFEEYDTAKVIELFKQQDSLGKTLGHYVAEEGDFGASSTFIDRLITLYKQHPADVINILMLEDSFCCPLTHRLAEKQNPAANMKFLEWLEQEELELDLVVDILKHQNNYGNNLGLLIASGQGSETNIKFLELLKNKCKPTDALEILSLRYEKGYTFWGGIVKINSETISKFIELLEVLYEQHPDKVIEILMLEDENGDTLGGEIVYWQVQKTISKFVDLIVKLPAETIKNLMLKVVNDVHLKNIVSLMRFINLISKLPADTIAILMHPDVWGPKPTYPIMLLKQCNPSIILEILSLRGDSGATLGHWIVKAQESETCMEFIEFLETLPPIEAIRILMLQNSSGDTLGNWVVYKKNSATTNKFLELLESLSTSVSVINALMLPNKSGFTLGHFIVGQHETETTTRFLALLGKCGEQNPDHIIELFQLKPEGQGTLGSWIVKKQNPAIIITTLKLLDRCEIINSLQDLNTLGMENFPAGKVFDYIIQQPTEQQFELIKLALNKASLLHELLGSSQTQEQEDFATKSWIARKCGATPKSYLQQLEEKKRALLELHTASLRSSAVHTLFFSKAKGRMSKAPLKLKLSPTTKAAEASYSVTATTGKSCPVSGAAAAGH